jgi:hypothetical protein
VSQFICPLFKHRKGKNLIVEKQVPFNKSIHLRRGVAAEINSRPTRGIDTHTPHVSRLSDNAWRKRLRRLKAELERSHPEKVRVESS